jgi:tetratricopeptide (TPR) repeat protein
LLVALFASVLHHFLTLPSKEELIKLNDLGYHLLHEGRMEEAEPLLQQAIAGARTVLGDRHRLTLLALNNLGGVLSFTGRDEEAKSAFGEMLVGCRATAGARHPDTLQALHNIGAILHKQKRHAEARPYLVEALQQRRAIATAAAVGDGSNNALLLDDEAARRPLSKQERHAEGLALDSTSTLAALLVDDGRLGEARTLYEQALRGRRKLLGDLDPKTLISICSLASLLQGEAGGRQFDARLDEAAALAREAVAGSRAALGDAHSQTLEAIVSLGSILAQQGRVTEAVLLFEEVHAVDPGAVEEHVLPAQMPRLLREIRKVRKRREEVAQGKHREIGMPVPVIH